MEKKDAKKDVRKLLEYVQPDAISNTAQELFEKDSQFSSELMDALPNLINARAKLVTAFAGAVQEMTPEDKREQVEKMIGQIDAEAVSQSVNSLSQMVIDLNRQYPDLIESARPKIEAAVAATDFGKLRERVVILSDMCAELTKQFLKPAMENPVIVANLAVMIVPLINNVIGVLSDALQKVKLPDEILASSLFNILGDIDNREIGRVTVAVAQMINGIHRGSIILGRDEPRFKKVFTELLDGIMDQIDPEELSNAVIALAEDGETAMQVIGELIRQDPQRFVRLVKTDVAITNAGMRAVSHILIELAAMPEEKIKQIGSHLQNDLDHDELGRMVDNFLAFADRFLELNPEFCVIDSILAKTDQERLGRVMTRAFGKISKAVVSDPGVSKALEPEQVGQKINTLVLRFNKWAGSEQKGKPGYLSRMMESIDSKELEKAMRYLMNGAIDALFSGAGKGMALLRPMISGTWKMVRFTVGSAGKRIFKRG